MAMNTSYINTAGSPAGTSDASQLAGSMSTFVAIDNAGTLTQTGIATFAAALNSASAISGGAGTFTTVAGTTITASSGLSVPKASKFYPASYTSTSADSSTMADGQMSIMSVSAGSCILAVRSGNTVYQFIADKANL